MKEILKSNKIRVGICLATALVFALFIAYHLYLFVLFDMSQIGRLIGIGSYVLFVAASILAMVSRAPFIQIGSVLMIIGLSLNFIIRLLNAGTILGRLDFAYVPTVLNAAVYLLQQLAVLILLVYYLVFRHNPRFKTKRTFVIILMSAVAVMYIGSLVMECVLLLKYRMNIDAGKWMTVCSRLLYCLGFLGIAVRFMLPGPEMKQEEDFGNPEQEDDEFLFSVPDEERAPVKRDVNAPVDSDGFLFSMPDEERAPVKKDVNPSADSDGFLFSVPDEERRPVKKDVEAPVNDDFLFLMPDSGKKSKKNKHRGKQENPALGEENKDFIL